MTVRTGINMGSPGALTVVPISRPSTYMGNPATMFVVPRPRTAAWQFTALAGYTPDTRHPMQVIEVTQSVAVTISVFMRDAATNQGVGGLSSIMVVNSKKVGAAFAVIAPTITDRGNGWYDLAFTAPMVDTLGLMPLRITAVGIPGSLTGQENNEYTINVIAVNKNDAIHFGLSSLPNASAAAVGGLSVITAVGQGPGGQIKPNSFTDQYVYNLGKMTSCRMRVFANKATADAALPTDADNFRGEVERYRITATYNIDGTVKTYEFAKEL